jgi:hypothetical protein
MSLDIFGFTSMIVIPSRSVCCEAAIIMSDRITMEFLGKARTFRARVGGEDEQRFSPARDAAYEQLRLRLRRKPSFREPECHDLLRLWQQAGQTYGQINAPRMQYEKRLVQFRSLRLLSAEGQSEAWADDEREAGLSMAMVQLSADSKTGLVQLKAQAMATFSLHAMARFYQRAFHASDDTLVSAIWSIMPSIKRLISTTTIDEFGVPVREAGGHWFGWINPVIHVDADGTDRHQGDALNVRTFHADRQDSKMWVRHADTSSWVVLKDD